jgi:hypothetical protein
MTLWWGVELLFLKGKELGLALLVVGVGPLLMQPTISLPDLRFRG